MRIFVSDLIGKIRNFILSKKNKLNENFLIVFVIYNILDTQQFLFSVRKMLKIDDQR